MTLAMTLVTPYGTWASTDHRLTTYPGGQLITDSSVKHVVIGCKDGSALISYTGLGRVGRIDVSQWMREVLRGESRTVDETLIDLREQATARIGLPAKVLNVQHVFLAGAYLSGHPWAVEIRNWQPPTAITPGGIQPIFQTSAKSADTSMLAVGGAGRDALLKPDLALLEHISQRRPRRPEDYMKLLGEVNRRAKASGRLAAKTISRSFSVVFMPPSGHDVQYKWYGPEDERHLAPFGISHLDNLGMDLGEVMREFAQATEGLWDGRITQEELSKRVVEAAERALKPRGRR